MAIVFNDIYGNEILLRKYLYIFKILMDILIIYEQKVNKYWE